MQDLQKTRVLVYDAAPDETYTDRTEEAFDLSQEPLALGLADTDFLYLGRRKPFSAIFVEADPDHPNTVAGIFTAEYWDGAEFVELALLAEDTRAAARSGFIKWAVPDDWDEVGVDGLDAFWIRLKPSASMLGSAKVRGINIVYADDRDLKREDFGIMTLLPKDEAGTPAATHVLSHVAARDAIVQELRRRGKIKLSAEDAAPEDIDEWDLLNIGQVRQAAVYKALSKIYLESSNTKDDINWAKYELAETNYKLALDMTLLALDHNDDGKEDQAEKTAGADPSGTFRRG